MGLKERQQIEHLKSEILPAQHQRLREHIGSEATFEPEWSSFEKDIDACHCLDYLMTSINNAFEWVASRPPGREVLTEAIETIVIQNSSDRSLRQISLNDKALKLICAVGSTDYDGRIGDGEVIKFLEDNL